MLSEKRMILVLILKNQTESITVFPSANAADLITRAWQCDARCSVSAQTELTVE